MKDLQGVFAIRKKRKRMGGVKQKDGVVGGGGGEKLCKIGNLVSEGPRKKESPCKKKSCQGWHGRQGNRGGRKDQSEGRAWELLRHNPGRVKGKANGPSVFLKLDWVAKRRGFEGEKKVAKAVKKGFTPIREPKNGDVGGGQEITA